MEWKVEGVTDGENEGDDCDEVIYVGWGEPGGEWTQWGWRNEEGSCVAFFVTVVVFDVIFTLIYILLWAIMKTCIAAGDNDNE